MIGRASSDHFRPAFTAEGIPYPQRSLTLHAGLQNANGPCTTRASRTVRRKSPAAMGTCLRSGQWCSATSATPRFLIVVGTATWTRRVGIATVRAELGIAQIDRKSTRL